LLIAGTGALACLFAARLASSGAEVVMLGNWPEGLAALRQYGVRLLDLDGSTKCFPVGVMEGNACKGSFKQSMVLVKSWQTERTVHQVEGCISADGIVLTLQNGLGNYEVLSQSLGKERVALGVTTVGARMLEPGYAQYTGTGVVSIEASQNLWGIDELLEKARFIVEVVSDPISLLWGKLVINAAINPLTAILRVPNGELLERPSTRELLAEAALEAAKVVEALGIKLPYADPVTAVEDVARKTATNLSSMLQDVLGGRTTEIEAISGAIVQHGEKSGIATPVNRVVWQLVRSMDKQ
jgi:2-dehydropantoate 2-reductase